MVQLIPKKKCAEIDYIIFADGLGFVFEISIWQEYINLWIEFNWRQAIQLPFKAFLSEGALSLSLC